MQTTQVVFRTTRENERPFVERYMPDAYRRLTAHEAVASVWFWRIGAAGDRGTIELAGGETITPGDGGAIVVVNGAPDPTAALDAETDRWDEHVDDGLLASWTRQPWDAVDAALDVETAREKMCERFGETGGPLNYRLRTATIPTTLELLERFDDDPPAVGDRTDTNPAGIGAWVLIHYLFKQSGYDWHEEMTACRRAIENRAHSLCSFHGAAAAREELDAVIAALEDTRAELGD
ncbi:hypothetical protein [Halosegnis sp.]|uniref:hypothetical protein n=1 Tax=Halosegnis sp. TaxID=2864959 RepID=UPI0035D47684